MKIFLKWLVITSMSLLITACNQESAEVSSAEDNSNAVMNTTDNWQLVWADEFDGDTIDTTKWGFEVNCHGGGNREQQCYTDRKKNAFISNGQLNIVALKETFTGPATDEAHNSETKTLPYTSARLRSMNKGDWQYGRFEIRAKLPQGQGIWPAIWMLPTDYVYGRWASSGEIDIMEAVNLKTQSDQEGAKVGELESRTYGTLHYGGVSPQNVYSGQAYNLPDGMNPADDFHTYAIEWQQGEIRWYVDQVHFATQVSSGWYSHYKNEQGELVIGEGDAPYNQKFYLLLNLAVGGYWPISGNDKGIDNSIDTQTMFVDFVRVYQCKLAPDTGIGCATIDKKAKLVMGSAVPSLR